MIKLFLQILKDESGVTLSITRKTANTLITATGFNTNYDEIEAVVNALTSANLSADSVLAAALGIDVVRTDYGLIQHTDGSLYVDLSDTTPALELTDGGLRAKVDDSTIERASGGLQLKDAGIVAAKIASDAVENAKIKDLAVTNAKIAATTIDLTTKVTGALPIANGGTGATTAALAHDAISALGAWVDKSASYGAQQAATDGFVVVSSQNASSNVVHVFTDSNADPTTERGRTMVDSGATTNNTLTIPVKKGDYWKVTVTGSPIINWVYWIPLGH